MEPENFELSHTEITHRLLTSVRDTIEQSNHQIESLTYEIVGNLSEISKSLEKQGKLLEKQKMDFDSILFEHHLNGIEEDVSDIVKGVDSLAETYRVCTNDLLSQMMKVNEQIPGSRNYHPWFLIITVLMGIGVFF